MRRKYGKAFIDYRNKNIHENKKYKNYIDRRWKFRWKQFIKYDHDWDYCYFIELIVFKLHLMLDFYTNGNYVQDDESRNLIVESLTEACSLGDMILEDKFDEKAVEFRQSHSALIKESSNSNALTTIWDLPENETKYSNLMIKAENVKEKTIDKFFKVIRSNFMTWWD